MSNFLISCFNLAIESLFVNMLKCWNVAYENPDFSIPQSRYFSPTLQCNYTQFCRVGQPKNANTVSKFLPNPQNIVDFRITYTLCIGEVRKPHLPGGGGVYLFFKFTINPVHPTHYFLKLRPEFWWFQNLYCITKT